MTLQEFRPENMYSRLLSASQEVIGLQWDVPGCYWHQNWFLSVNDDTSACSELIFCWNICETLAQAMLTFNCLHNIPVFRKISYTFTINEVNLFLQNKFITLFSLACLGDNLIRNRPIWTIFSRKIQKSLWMIHGRSKQHSFPWPIAEDSIIVFLYLIFV